MSSTTGRTPVSPTPDAWTEPTPCPLCGRTECADELDAYLKEAQHATLTRPVSRSQTTEQKGPPMPPPHPQELWGHCPNCRRWFYIQARHTDRVNWQCPVCGAEPEQIENRAHPAFTGTPSPRPLLAAPGEPPLTNPIPEGGEAAAP